MFQICYSLEIKLLLLVVVGVVFVSGLWVLPFARRLILLNICMLFHQDILNGFQVIERALFCNGRATLMYFSYAPLILINSSFCNNNNNYNFISRG